MQFLNAIKVISIVRAEFVKYCSYEIYRISAILWQTWSISSILVPPEKPKIFDERGQEVRLKLGPYKVGENVSLKCVAIGGKSKARKTVL